MRVEVVVPQIGEAVAELMLVEWHKQVGDTIKKGEVLFDIDSDKAIVEVDAFVDGKLIEILYPNESSVLPQQVVAIIETIDETTIPKSKATPDVLEPATSPNGRKISPVAQRFANEHDINTKEVVGTGPSGRIIVEDVRQLATTNSMRPHTNPQAINVSPKARLLAKGRNIDLRTLVGTGVGDMIRVKDVEQALQAQPIPTISANISGNQLELSKLRQTVAKRTLTSKQSVPHFYLMVDVEMTECNRLRTYCVDRLQWQKAPTYTAILLRACALALNAFPSANRSYRDGSLAERSDINIGVATNTSEGLVVPVIPDANQHGLRDLSSTLQDTAQRARSGRLRPSDMGDKSMVISNLGMYAVDQFIAIIDMPDPMILAVGRVADRVVPVDGQVTILPMCTLSLSVDHRVMDGVQGAQFLERVKDYLENPFEILNS